MLDLQIREPRDYGGILSTEIQTCKSLAMVSMESVPVVPSLT